MNNKEKLKKHKKRKLNVIKEIKSNNIKYINFKIRKAKRKLNFIIYVLYLSGILILISLPLTLIETFEITSNLTAIFLFENIILTIAPIFFGFCLFKSFEWNQEYKDLIESNIVYNIDFIKIINWEFRKIVKTIDAFVTIKGDSDSQAKKINLINNEMDSLINYINEYSHFNSEKFEQEIIFSIQREWYKILDIVNFIKKTKNVTFNNKIEELDRKIKTLKHNKKNIEITNKEIYENIEYESIYKFGNSINIMNEWNDVLKNFLNMTYRSGLGSKLDKLNYKKIIKYYIYIINYHDIKYITDNIFLNPYIYKVKKHKNIHH